MRFANLFSKKAGFKICVTGYFFFVLLFRFIAELLSLAWIYHAFVLSPYRTIMGGNVFQSPKDNAA